MEQDFPWLRGRHEHIPRGHTPAFEFPEVFGSFLQAGTLDDARVRWQLATALNEVQQASYSAFFARRFDLPEIARHGEREAELARNYFGHAGYTPE